MDSIPTDINLLPCNTVDIWGGIECTINRINNTFRDQLLYAGHYNRMDDIDAIASLNIRMIRYPVLWERHQPVANAPANWKWITGQLTRLSKYNIEPIAGLLHHGSGPSYTNLLDPLFPMKLAAYAKQVAMQFPWISCYTPVNEPLTTARFSGLYGCWYPHHKNELSFIRMLLNQLKGIILSMQAIRSVNPSAKLIQTEDLAKTYSSPSLSYQAEFENARRWLTYDLLCGKFDRQHFFWKYFKRSGIKESELTFFIENKCSPDIAGFNYYITSERYLDKNIHRYPNHMHGGNAKDRYTDVEAVRVGKLKGVQHLLTEAWKRYKLPLAITECHLNCTREEQLRWFRDLYDSCVSLNKKGIPVKAITAWSLLGAFDWNSLLTLSNNHYESGVFDVSSGRRRPTALANMIRSLSVQKQFDHPVLSEKGWWEKGNKKSTLIKRNKQNAVPLLITGKTGTLGQAFMRICERRSIPFIAVARNEVDISKETEIRSAIDKYRPWAVVNAAGYVKVDKAETECDACYAANAKGPKELARITFEKGIQFMSFSSDLVFDGSKKLPYHEFDETSPLNIYGKAKAEGEKKSLLENNESLIIRTSSFFGPWDKFNFAHSVLCAVNKHQDIHAPYDVIVSPTYVPDLVDMSLNLLIDKEKGIWHLCNDGSLSWADFAKEIIQRCGAEARCLRKETCEDMEWLAKRPLYSALKSERGIILPKIGNAIDRYFTEKIF